MTTYQRLFVKGGTLFKSILKNTRYGKIVCHYVFKGLKERNYSFPRLFHTPMVAKTIQIFHYPPEFGLNILALHTYKL